MTNINNTENTFTRNLMDERFYNVECNEYGFTTLSSKTFRATDIEGYYISHDGYVMSIKGKGFPIILSECDNGNGYSQVLLCDNGKRKKEYVHRLVGKAWIDNPMNKEQVNHKDRNKKNNHISNLEWNTPKENIKHKSWLDRLRKCCGSNYMADKESKSA